MVILYLHQKYQKILHFIFMLRLLYFSMSNDYESLGVGLRGRKSELVSDVVFNNMFRFKNESKCIYNPKPFHIFNPLLKVRQKISSSGKFVKIRKLMAISHFEVEALSLFFILTLRMNISYYVCGKIDEFSFFRRCPHYFAAQISADGVEQNRPKLRRTALPPPPPSPMISENDS